MPGSRETPKGFIGDSHNPIIQSLIDTGAVDFNAIGRAVAEIGPSAGALRASGEDWFCKFYHSFIHIYILRKVATLAFGFRVLTRVEDEVGYLPSLSLSEERYRELESVERKRYVVAEAYHTVYVMGLLCAATLQAGAPPPEPLSARRATGLGDELVELLVPREPAPQWERDLEELEPRQREALAPFLASVALQRAVEASAFERIREVLAMCVERGVKPSDAMTQAADLLVRVAESPYAAAQR